MRIKTQLIIVFSTLGIVLSFIVYQKALNEYKKNKLKLELQYLRGYSEGYHDREEMDSLEFQISIPQ